MSKKRRALAVVEAGEPEPTVVLLGIWKVPGKGYSWARCEVPQSVAERFADEQGASEPDVLEVALSKVELAMRREVMG